MIKRIDSPIPNPVYQALLEDQLIILFTTATTRGWGLRFGFGLKNGDHPLHLRRVTRGISRGISQRVGVCGTTDTTRNDNVERTVNTIDSGGTLLGVSSISLKRNRATAVKRYCWRRGVRNGDHTLGRRFISGSVSGGIGQRIDTRRCGIDGARDRYSDFTIGVVIGGSARISELCALLHTHLCVTRQRNRGWCRIRRWGWWFNDHRRSTNSTTPAATAGSDKQR